MEQEFKIDSALRTKEQLRRYDEIIRKANDDANYHDFPKPWKVVPDTQTRVKTTPTSLYAFSKEIIHALMP